MRFDPGSSGHRPTDYTAWFRSAEPYPVQWQERYEPWVFVDRLGSSWADARFRGYGKNKIVHVSVCVCMCAGRGGIGGCYRWRMGAAGQRESYAGRRGRVQLGHTLATRHSFSPPSPPPISHHLPPAHPSSHPPTSYLLAAPWIPVPGSPACLLFPMF